METVSDAQEFNKSLIRDELKSLQGQKAYCVGKLAEDLPAWEVKEFEQLIVNYDAEIIEIEALINSWGK